MAEGIEIELPVSTAKYFCHQCIQEVSAIHPDLTCPHCLTGFIEELSHESEDADDESDQEEGISLIEAISIDDLINRTLRRTILDFEEHENVGSRAVLHLLRNRQRRNGQRSSAIDRSLQNLIAEFEDDDEPFQPFQNLGDYAFGVEWDTIITQFLNEAEISGPAPLPKEQIELLPDISIAKEHVEKGQQCTVCMDDFDLGERVKLLPCEHFYHEKCIVPWLERHATCPVCRKEVEVKSRARRSQSCPRSSLNSTSSENSSSSRRSSNSSSSADFGLDLHTTSINPFRYL